jgi:hypothetical protein
MRFQIRNLDSDSNEYEASQVAYMSHLRPFKKTSNTDLWKFFTEDFFHDGTIESIEFKPDLHTVMIRLDCPNIRALKEDGSFNFVNVGFTCTFNNVIRFSTEDSGPAEWGDKPGGYSKFRYSEINTTIPSDLPGESDDFYSLIIECIGESDSVWIEMVFSQVDVEPCEPAAFAIMVSSPQFIVPTFIPNA